MKLYFLILAFLLTLNSVFAETFSVSGTVLDSTTKQGLQGVSVSLSHLMKDIKTGGLTNNKGYFIIENLERGKYNLKCTFIGRKSFDTVIFLRSANVKLGNIYLAEEGTVTGEVEVVAPMPAVELKGDTTQFNAGAYKTNPDATAEDLVQKMPGVVLQDNKIQAQGENVKKVLMDGKPFFGDDPTAALKNLPADVVEKVQVYDEKSEQSQFTGFDDGNTSKTLNIITRSNMRTGQFGKIYAGYGNNDYYQAGTNFNIFGEDSRTSILAQSNNVNQQNFAIEDILGAVTSIGSIRSPFFGAGMRPPGGGQGFRRSAGAGPGFFGSSGISDFLVGNQSGITSTNAFGINYTDNWSKSIKVTGSYFFNWGDNNSLNETYREYVSSDNAGQIYNENSESNSTNINHRFNFRFDWDIDSSNSILMQPRLSVQQNDGNSLTNAKTSLLENSLNTSENDFKSNLLGYNFSNEILWRHKFETKGRTISISVTPGLNNNSGNNKLNATSKYFRPTEVTDSLDQKSDLTTDGLNLSYNIAYTEPIADKSQLQINYSGRYNQNESNKTTNNYDPLAGNYDAMDTSLSNIFSSNYMNNNLGTTYRYQNVAYNYSIGLSYQNSRLYNLQDFPYSSETDKSFNNILPNASFQYNFTKRNNIRLFYRTSTNLPSIEQLQDVVNNSNPLQISVGNPNLSESYEHSLYANFMAVNEGNSSNFFINVGGRYVNNYIGQKTTIIASDTILNNGYFVQQGVQLSQRVNLDNYASFRSFISYGFPVSFISSNLNLNAAFMYSKTPGIYNNEVNNSHSKSINFGAVITSNISEKFDFTLMSWSNYNIVTNSIRTSSNTEYFSQRSNFRVNFYLWEFLVLQS
ncbi:TonB-dependent receptor, partial [Bacteroidetes/Chlorobi group bacterium ChocPot_Mid]